MLRGISIVLLVYGALSIDVSTGIAAGGSAIRPVFLPLILASVICLLGRMESLVGSALIAAVADCLSVAGPGPLMLASVTLAWIVHACFETRWMESSIVRLLLVFILTQSYLVLPTLVDWMRHGSESKILDSGFWQTVMSCTVCTMIAAIVMLCARWMLGVFLAGLLPDSRGRLGNRWSMLTG